MPYYRCNLSRGGVKLPDSVTFSGNGTTSIGNLFADDNGQGTHKGLAGSASITIPTFGYKKADISASSSSIGTGNDIDISNTESITVVTNYALNLHHHDGAGSHYYYGGGSGAYTVVLHN